MEQKYIEGYSLTETIVAMAIAAILAGMAVPAYNAFWERHKIKQLQLHLVELQTLQERFRLANGRYAQAGELGVSEFNEFDITVEGVSTFTYTLVASNRVSQNTHCVHLTINHASERTPANCWD